MGDRTIKYLIDINDFNALLNYHEDGDTLWDSLANHAYLCRGRTYVESMHSELVLLVVF